MFIVKYYILAAIACLFAALFIPYIWGSLFFGWCCLSLTLVSIAYIFDIPSIFRKNQDGKIVWWIRWAFIPFLLGAKAYNAWAIKRDKVEPIQKITDNVYLSRRLFPSDLSYLESQNIHCIVDATAEFAGLESAMTDKRFDYFNTPVLDHKVPKLRHLKHTLNWMETQINQSRTLVVHCALGRGRSVFIVAAYLLAKDPSLSVEQALQQINDIRSTARLNKFQLKTLKAISEKGLLSFESPCCLIVNPVSGGGKWKHYQQQVIRELTKKYSLDVKETTETTSANTLAEQAIKRNASQIIVSGGDGTVSEVATHLIKTDIPLGIVPLGTANALCHVLYGIASKVSPVEKACEAILSGNTRNIDVAYCNDQLVLLVLGIGFEEQMIDFAHREQKNAMGQFAYLTGFFSAFVAGEQQRFRVAIDDQPAQQLDLQSLVVANTSPFSTILAQGGGEPQPDDGKLHVTYLESTESLAERMLALSDIVVRSLGAKDETSHFDYVAAQRIRIDSEHAINYAIDGEIYTAKSFDVSVKKQALTVCVP